MIVLIPALDHQKRWAVQTEIKPIAVAFLRVWVRTVRVRRIAVVDSNHNFQLIVGLDGNAHAGRRQWIGRTALGKSAAAIEGQPQVPFKKYE